jgi:hypothetical protein
MATRCPSSWNKSTGPSPAIGAGDNSLLPADEFDLDGDSNTTEPLPVDQRGPGFPRAIGGTVDIGAFEVQNSPPEIDDDQSFSVDENSNNGTHVNGGRIQPGVWTPAPGGSLVRFGPVEFNVRLE